MENSTSNIVGTLSDVRNRIVRRILISFLIPILRFFPKRWSSSFLLQNEYRKLYQRQKLPALRSNANHPTTHILATGMGTGCVVAFNADQVVQTSIKDPADRREHPGDDIEISLAVAASSAFPPLFRPVEIDKAIVGLSKEDQSPVEFLTDGGIYDNLGVRQVSNLEERSSPFDLVILSDAGAALAPRLTNPYVSILRRNIRTTDILMARLGLLDRARIDASRRILIGFEKPEKSALNTYYWNRAARIRTDLNKFSTLEVYTLILCGYESARGEWTTRYGANAISPSTFHRKWEAMHARAVERAGADGLKGSDKPGWLTWLSKDGAQFAIMLTIVLYLGIIGAAGWAYARSRMASAHSWSADDAIESVRAYESQLQNADVGASFRETALRDHHIARTNAIKADVSNLEFLWFVTKSNVFQIRHLEFKHCADNRITFATAASTKSNMATQVYVRHGDEFVFAPSGQVNCDGLIEVLLVAEYEEKVTSGNFLFMQSSNYNQVSKLDFSVVLPKARLARPDPQLHEVISESGKPPQGLQDLGLHQLGLKTLENTIPTDARSLAVLARRAYDANQVPLKAYVSAAEDASKGWLAAALSATRELVDADPEDFNTYIPEASLRNNQDVSVRYYLLNALGQSAPPPGISSTP